MDGSAYPGTLACPACSKALPAALINTPDLERCPACLTRILVEVYPAQLAPPAIGSAGEALLLEGESSCFYHVTKRAVVACESCGRFLCALCDVDLNGRHLCTACLQTGKRKGKLKHLENRRTLYDRMALMLALLPMLIFYFTILTAPATIYVVLRHWNSPGTVVGRGRWRMVVAFIVATLQIIGWIVGITLIVHYAGAGRRHQ